MTAWRYATVDPFARPPAFNFASGLSFVGSPGNTIIACGRLVPGVTSVAAISRDGALTWTYLPMPTGFSSTAGGAFPAGIASSPAAGPIIIGPYSPFVEAHEAVLGDPWLYGSPQPSGPAPFSVAFNGATTQAWIAGDSASVAPLYVTNDGGASWVPAPAFPTGSFIPPGSGATIGRAVDALGSTIVMAGDATSPVNTSALAVSTDGGASWTVHAIPGGAGGFFAVFTVKIVGSRIFIGGENVTGSTRIAYSDDLGASFSTPSTFPPGTTLGAVNSIATDGRGTLWAACARNAGVSTAVVTSVDNGVTWAADDPFPAGECRSIIARSGLVVAAGRSSDANAHCIAFKATTTPPTRQFPRDDTQGVSTARVRIGRAQPTSRQHSYRQGFRGTYT